MGLDLLPGAEAVRWHPLVNVLGVITGWRPEVFDCICPSDVLVSLQKSPGQYLHNR